MSEEKNIEERQEETESREENQGKNISPPEAIAPTEPETQNSKHETENMEVHHHPHVEKKNFKEYLLEGLMIFLAVTMGFFAENIREHFADVRIEKEYLSTYKQQLLINKEQLLDLKNLIVGYK